MRFTNTALKSVFLRESSYSLNTHSNTYYAYFKMSHSHLNVVCHRTYGLLVDALIDFVDNPLEMILGNACEKPPNWPKYFLSLYVCAP